MPPTGTELANNQPKSWQRIEPSGDYRVRQTVRFPEGTVVTGVYQPPQMAALPNEDPGFIPAQVTPLSADYLAGTDVYDWHRLNELLVAGGMNGWQIVAAASGSHQPIPVQTTKPNPEWANMTDEERAANPEKQFTTVQSGEYIITARGPDGTIRKLTVARAGDKSNYSWALLDTDDIVKADPTKQGYSSPQRLPFGDHEEVWGINNATGRFEKIPDVPNLTSANNKNWTSVQLIDMPDGTRQWWGTPPEGGPPKPVPDMPVIPSKAGYSGIIQVQRGNELVYMGQNTATGKYEDVVGLPHQPMPVTRTTYGGITYQPDPNDPNKLIPAQGVAQPIEGQSTRWVPAEAGYAKQQTFRNGDWQDDINVPHKAVSAEAARTEGAIRQKGEHYRIQQMVNGVLMWVPVIARGDGTYDPDEGGKMEPVSGQPSTSVAQATAADQEFQQRYDPATGQYTTVRNPNYAPTQIADRVRQLKQLAGDKQRELNAQISAGKITEAQADEQFNQWWDQEIEPRSKQLQFDLEQTRLKSEREGETQRASNLTTASNLGQAAVERYQAMQKNMVGPGYGQQMKGLTEAIAAGKPAPPLDIGAFQYQGPDFNQLHQYYTAQALKNISPTAANLAGGQPPALLGLDPQNLINRTQYHPGGGTININISGGGGPQATAATPAAPVAAGPAPPAAPAAPAPIDLGTYSNLMPPVRGLLTG